MIGNNLKYLRKKNLISQQALSDILCIPRTTLGDYEREKTEPNISMLVNLANYFKVSLDQLISDDLSLESYEVAKSADVRILAISLDNRNESNIELVDSKAEAGYLDSYQNPEYIKDLPKIQFPNIPEGTYRGFEIQGDSMLPIESGSIIICSYVERLSEIKDNCTYVIISKTNGLVYKRVKAYTKEKKLILSSDNDEYMPYEIAYSEIDEIWQYYAHLSFSDSKKSFDKNLSLTVNEIHKKVTALHNNLTQS